MVRRLCSVFFLEEKEESKIGKEVGIKRKHIQLKKKKKKKAAGNNLNRYLFVKKSKNYLHDQHIF